ncbi:MAG: hypothetical protein AAF090_08785 [Bacteroidota bacterium]
MIDNLPIWIDVLFIIACILTILLFHYGNGKPLKVTLGIVLWCIGHSVLALNGFYQITDSIPPRFGLVLVPSALLIVYGLLPKQQDWLLEKRNMVISTFLHIVRVPVEIVLLGLFLNQMIPELMTFEGRNFDIVMGITAPIIGFLLLKKRISKKALLVWNIVGLFLVTFILVNGILSAELPFQQFAFDQPNRGISYFPYVLLPATIVPIVIWTHLSDILILLKKQPE